MRASDADRERLVEQLREHHAAGRLSMDEFEERMGKAYAAKTYGDLRVLTRDLPVDLAQLNIQQAQQRTVTRHGPIEVTRTPDGHTRVDLGGPLGDRIQERIDRRLDRVQGRIDRRTERAVRRGGAAGKFASWLSLSVLLTGIWLITNLAGGGGWSDFWPIWPIGIMGLLMLVNVIGGGGRRNR